MPVLNLKIRSRALTLWLGAILLLADSALAADYDWAGGWDTVWRDGGAHLLLKRDGRHVSGEYPLYGGTVDALANGNQLTGQWSEGVRSGQFLFSMAEDGQSFTGRFDNGEWWTGGRSNATQPALMIDQSGVRQTLRTFVEGGNLADAGVVEALGASAAVLDFGEHRAAIPQGQKLAAARNLHDLVDLTTFQLWSIPGKRASGSSYSLSLKQAGSSATLPLDFTKNPDGKWSITMPTDETLAASRNALLARFGGRLPEPSGYLKLRSARDTMTAFLSAFADWNRGGRQAVLDTLDTSQLFTATRAYEGLLAAQYLKLVLDRVKEIIPQEIPDDPADRQPYTVFDHPLGKIVLAPVGDADKATWRFTPETLAHIRALYAAVETMPVAGTQLLAPPQSRFFAVRAWLRLHAPSLLTPLGPVERWQILGAGMGVLACLLVATIIAFAAGRLIRWDVGGRALKAERALRWPLRLALAAILFKLVIPVLGWPEEVRQYSAPIHALIIGVFGVWAGWYLIDALSYNVVERAKHTDGTRDDITISLCLGAVRILLVFAAVVYVATELSIPTDGLLAGLGLSGLAIAFASKETLSNVFGAGILVADHPFRKGDWITAGEIQGTVEKVGIRSTRIRTLEDTEAIVPNGKLSDALINNWGSRRHRLLKGRLLINYAASTKLECFMEAVRLLLAKSPCIVGGRTQVGIASLGADGIEVELTCYLSVANAAEEKSRKSELLLGILHLAEDCGVAVGNMIVPETSSALSVKASS